ncbi:MAG: hypothetical protein KJ955_06370 [Nanoarchaeota archaeon]|nr:hypothetical protein [Nanoarchaeota archaeon]
MNRIIKNTLGAVVGIGIALSAGCDYKTAGQSSIFIPAVSCREVPGCGTVCYDELDSGRRLITIDNQERTKNELKEYCRLDRVCETNDGLRLWQ